MQSNKRCSMHKLIRIKLWRDMRFWRFESEYNTMRKVTSYQLPVTSSKGFTLIELLVVIAIIGILATIVMVNVLSVRSRARDTQRKSDIRQIQSALELYRADQGSYPNGLPACNSALTA